MSFNHFGLSPEVVRGTHAMGFVEPTPIQLRAFPIVLAGKDLIGTAQTGTGKTAAFALRFSHCWRSTAASDVWCSSRRANSLRNWRQPFVIMGASRICEWPS